MARDRRVAIILMHLADSERGESGAFFAPESPFRTAAPESLLNSETVPLGRFLFSEDIQPLAGENPIGGGISSAIRSSNTPEVEWQECGRQGITFWRVEIDGSAVRKRRVIDP